MKYLELCKREFFLKSILSILNTDAKLILKIDGALLEATTYKFSSNSKNQVKAMQIDKVAKKYCFKDIALLSFNEFYDVKEYEINQLINTYDFDKNIFELALFDFITTKNVKFINIKNENFSNYLYDVKFLDSDLKLNFYKLSEEDNIEIVSLKLITN